jgi:hypothetical protein
MKVSDENLTESKENTATMPAVWKSSVLLSRWLHSHGDIEFL